MLKASCVLNPRFKTRFAWKSACKRCDHANFYFQPCSTQITIWFFRDIINSSWKSSLVRWDWVYLLHLNNHHLKKGRLGEMTILVYSQHTNHGNVLYYRIKLFISLSIPCSRMKIFAKNQNNCITFSLESSQNKFLLRYNWI